MLDKFKFNLIHLIKQIQSKIRWTSLFTWSFSMETDFLKILPHEFHSGIFVEYQGYEWDEVGAIWGFLLLCLCQPQANPLSFETNFLLEMWMLNIDKKCNAHNVFKASKQVIWISRVRTVFFMSIRSSLDCTDLCRLSLLICDRISIFWTTLEFSLNRTGIH